APITPPVPAPVVPAVPGVPTVVPAAPGVPDPPAPVALVPAVPVMWLPPPAGPQAANNKIPGSKSAQVPEERPFTATSDMMTPDHFGFWGGRDRRLVHQIAKAPSGHWSPRSEVRTAIARTCGIPGGSDATGRGHCSCGPRALYVIDLH